MTHTAESSGQGEASQRGRFCRPCDMKGDYKGPVDEDTYFFAETTAEGASVHLASRPGHKYHFSVDAGDPTDVAAKEALEKLGPDQMGRLGVATCTRVIGCAAMVDGVCQGLNLENIVADATTIFEQDSGVSQ